MDTLQKRLREARKKAGLSQSQVAKKIGISQPTYSELESGKSKSTTFLPQLAVLYNVSAIWLAEGKGTADAMFPAGWERVLRVIAAASPEEQDRAREMLEVYFRK